ncbi:uncharacterized protein LOC115218515 isoform X1 [Octopus sinensis]|uniref:Uncharacterized protein LOC115218515 isoform X1 n=1 Tax=Octopus sinensis TaxID=2607531 RepID=A0A7E6F9X2_9MOLL|nr:uncharacterized protein LOC115218515 isoform X1 [Octopus sinensis]
MKSGKVNPRYAIEIDIQKLIEDLVWKKFLKSLHFSCLRRCFYRRNAYHIEIRWSYFSFEDFLESEVPLRKEPTKSLTQYSTTYTCQITGPQKHIFNAQGSQMESRSVKLQKNYSIGGKVSIKAAGLEFNAGGKRDNSQEDKTDTTTSWSDTAEFTLNTNNSAKVVITQEKGISEKYFVVKTLLRLRPTHPGWGAPVIVRKKSNHQKVFEYEIISFRELFEAYSECADLVEIRPQAHLQQFEDGNSQYYDEVYIFSRGIETNEEEKRNVNIAAENN